MTTPDTTGTVERELRLPQPPAEVWRALTDSAALAEWLLPNDFQPQVGHGFQFRSQPAGDWDGVIDCRVIECDPGRRLVYSWASLGVDTRVTFELQPDGAGTLLRFAQTGFDLTRPFGNQARAGAEYGWTGFLANLERHLAA